MYALASNASEALALSKVDRTSGSNAPCSYSSSSENISATPSDDNSRIPGSSSIASSKESRLQDTIAPSLSVPPRMPASFLGLTLSCCRRCLRPCRRRHGRSLLAIEMCRHMHLCRRRQHVHCTCLHDLSLWRRGPKRHRQYHW